MHDFSPNNAASSGGHYNVDSGGPDHYFPDSGISVTPATPPNGMNPQEIYDTEMARVPQTPISDSGSCDSGYSPTPSDASPGSQPEHLYHSDLFANYQALPFPPSSESPLQMFAHMALDEATRLSPAARPLQFPYTTSSSHSGDTLSPMQPLLAFSDFSDCEHWSPFEDTPGASATHSPLDSPSLLLSDPTTSPPGLGFQSGTAQSAFGSRARVQSDLTSLAASSDRLTAPPRRHSFNTHQSGSKFFMSSGGGSGRSTPETSSPSPVPGSATAGYPDLPVLHHEVASQAGVHAANLRRTKPAKFRCDICSHTFTTKHNLTNHRNSHAGIKPYACRLCGDRFTTRSVQTRHEKKNHDKQDWAQLG
ncbi:C2H2 type zinc finger domain-containing protein [Mycena sanguinolenta]|uniref:C2H2 type zinc finger domain-containing protein n=1 Tax=Mycena sanguinolenta TaxID=230812 RepID=A0A8H7DKA6_9AGAR|nr:C2H2 type zinc finger domain-containing protein [Mycena sanguinolenta]